ncbi:MAG: RnfABCDGE type electron transport complex subunit B, partial [Firmicutes bacterium]|nr:RnfABCDGE type electron transport complex subunit B [Bacillota bacterium]
MVAAILTLGGLGLIFGGLLALAAQRFAVEEDPRVAQIEEALPGANCGACGYAGCANFAEAVAKGEAEPTGCIPGGKDTSQAICKILGKDAEGSESCRQVAEVGCIGDKETAKDRFQYDGVKDCRAAQMYNGGFKGCPYGCLGLGTCAAVCPFEAIAMNEKGLPEIDEERCTGCGICVNQCPRGVLRLKDADRKGHVVLCNSKDKAKIVRSVCDVGCIACKACER